MANLSSLLNNGKLRITGQLIGSSTLSADTFYDTRISTTTGITFLPSASTIANNLTSNDRVTAKQVVDYLKSLTENT